MTREQFLQELRRLAKAKDIKFDILKGSGKGSHYKIIFGDRATTLKSGEMTPGYVRLVRKQLGID